MTTIFLILMMLAFGGSSAAGSLPSGAQRTQKSSPLKSAHRRLGSAYTRSYYVPVFREPTVRSAQLVVLPIRTKIDVLETGAGDDSAWTKIRLKKLTGYVWTDNLSANKEHTAEETREKERRQLIDFCYMVYGETNNKRQADLTLDDIRRIKKCQAAGIDPWKVPPR